MPIYEFGFGLSYTTFEYSNLQVASYNIGPYIPIRGLTAPAPTYGTITNNTADYVFPPGFDQLDAYIYPFLNSTNLRTASKDPLYGTNYTWPAAAYDTSPQRRLPAGGQPGGNPGLYENMFTIKASITNTGALPGDEVPQLYLSLGGPYDPPVQLRGFDRLTIEPGATETFVAQLTRRDLSNWDPASQNWVVSTYPKTVYVGSSSRMLPLSQELEMSCVMGRRDPSYAHQ